MKKNVQKQTEIKKHDSLIFDLANLWFTNTLSQPFFNLVLFFHVFKSLKVLNFLGLGHLSFAYLRLGAAPEALGNLSPLLDFFFNGWLNHHLKFVGPIDFLNARVIILDKPQQCTMKRDNPHKLTYLCIV